MQVIFSCEDKAYMWWQAELLQYSFAKSGMKAQLTALVSPNGAERNAFTGNTVRVASYKELCEREPLMVLNKPGAIAEWAMRDSGSQESVLIVDPDSVFHRPVHDVGPIAPGEAYSEEHDYMAVDIPANRLVIERHCPVEVRSRIQPVGIYVLVNRATLVELSRRWLEKAVEIASDPVCREALSGTGWLSDMWGYAIAAAELGIRHNIRGFSQVTGSNSLQFPIVHYCYPLLVNPEERWHPESRTPLLWSKWHYQPWSPPPHPAHSIAEGRFVLQQLWELAVLKTIQQNPPPAGRYYQDARA